jgi:hypothetical protein
LVTCSSKILLARGRFPVKLVRVLRDLRPLAA